MSLLSNKALGYYLLVDCHSVPSHVQFPLLPSPPGPLLPSLPPSLSLSQAYKEFLVKDAATAARIAELREKVEAFSKRYPMPGFEDK